MRTGKLAPYILIATLTVATILAYLDPPGVAELRQHASENAGRFALAVASAAFSARLTLDLALFGARATIAFPVFLILSIPYALRLAVVEWAAWRRRGQAPVELASRPYPEGAPAAMPARMAVALLAAARARA